RNHAASLQCTSAIVKALATGRGFGAIRIGGRESADRAAGTPPLRLLQHHHRQPPSPPLGVRASTATYPRSTVEQGCGTALCLFLIKERGGRLGDSPTQWRPIRSREENPSCCESA